MTTEELKVFLTVLDTGNFTDVKRVAHDAAKAIRQLAKEVPCPEGHLSLGGMSICETCNGTGLKYNLEG